MVVWLKAVFLYGITLTVCLPIAAQIAWVNESISPETAYQRLQQTGELNDAVITGAFDLARLTQDTDNPEAATSYHISNVVFTGPVTLLRHELDVDIRIQNSQFEHAIHMQQCGLQRFILSESTLSGELVVRDCTFNGSNRFNDNRFHSTVQFHISTFLHNPSFRNAVFSDRVEFLECEFGHHAPARKAVSFANAVFNGPAIFNRSHFLTPAKFQSVRFSQDASFLNTRFESDASFRNVHFMGDAEFRFCEIGSADFGDRDNLTLFAQRADFRGCQMNSARFDTTEFRGETSFVDTVFGAGGASFRYANFGHNKADFFGIKIDTEGLLDFSQANVTAMHFYWQEIRRPFLATHPDSRILAAFLSRLKAIGDTQGALDVSYHLENQKFLESIATPLPDANRESMAFLDAAGQRFILYTERIVWGLPTGYGTKSGRILLIALVLWLVSALPVMLKGSILARIPCNRGGNTASPDGSAKIYQSVQLAAHSTTAQFPASRYEHTMMAFLFTFRILFKIGSNTIRYVVQTPNSEKSLVNWKHYFATLWLLGSLLLILMGLTFANTSPIISKLVGELLV